MNIVVDIMNKIIDNVEKSVLYDINALSVILDETNKYNILNEPTLKLAHCRCIMNKISPQVAGNLIEQYIIIHFNMIKNNPTKTIGDAKLNSINYEIKASFGGANRNKFNYVQIRPNHNCSYIFTAYYLTNKNLYQFGDLFVFKLNKLQMINLICQYGSYAHGSKSKLGTITKESINDIKNKNYEYALRVLYQSKCWNNLLQFRIDPLNI